jgi:hypothetical protein
MTPSLASFGVHFRPYGHHKGCAYAQQELMPRALFAEPQKAAGIERHHNPPSAVRRGFGPALYRFHGVTSLAPVAGSQLTLQSAWMSSNPQSQATAA